MVRVEARVIAARGARTAVLRFKSLARAKLFVEKHGPRFGSLHLVHGDPVDRPQGVEGTWCPHCAAIKKFVESSWVKRCETCGISVKSCDVRRTNGWRDL